MSRSEYDIRIRYAADNKGRLHISEGNFVTRSIDFNKSMEPNSKLQYSSFKYLTIPGCSLGYR
ncbi:hypothetical protein CN353_26575 [Bacillus cereus]|nr:hypothetical protein CN353_26575 [Bacillus cereus]PGV94108.1 hypothetical protein COD80_16990 [Bacillus cereus]PGY22213.1 hypothetical protein COE27_29560 [Bacillus cereus]